MSPTRANIERKNRSAAGSGGTQLARLREGGNVNVLNIVVPLAGITAFFVLVYFLVRNAVVKKKLVCPVRGNTVEVEFLRQGFHGEGPPLRVVSCSAFPNPRKLECKQECLKTAS
jgi:hypothetical protein